MNINVDEFENQLKDFLKDKGVEGAVIGISGGKDSTIVAKLMCDILGKENIVGVLMPCGVQKDIADSKRVVDLLGIRSVMVNVGEAFESLLENIDVSMSVMNSASEIDTLNKDEVTFGVTRDARINLAPRLRMAALYAVAQSMGHGWRVIGTTNKSEEYIGWLTKWGDGGCDIEPIIDLTVTDLRKFGCDLGLPKDLVCKVPVDGLTPSTDEERFGFTYTELDKYITEGTSGNAVIDRKIQQMHTNSEHKRQSIPKFKFEE